MILRVSFPLAGLLLAASAGGAAAEVLTEQSYRQRYEALLSTEEVRAQGRPRIVDGDTLEIAGVSIRLAGIDAPEQRETCGPTACGRAAGRALGRFAGDWVGCEILGGDPYGRLVGVCHGAAGELGAAMVRFGYARAWDQRYAAEEAEARAEQSGFWQPEAIRPEDW